MVKNNICLKCTAVILFLIGLGISILTHVVIKVQGLSVMDVQTHANVNLIADALIIIAVIIGVSIKIINVMRGK